MRYLTPNCFNCKFFRGAPEKFGEIAKCEKYRRGIPVGIYPQGKQCSYFTPKETKIDGRRKK